MKQAPHRGIRYVTLKGLEQLFDCLPQHVDALCSDELLSYFAILDEEDRGDITHAEAAGEFFVLVDVTLPDRHTTFILLCKLLDEGTYHLAGTAPCGPKVHYHGLAISNKGLEDLAVDF